MTGPEKNPTEYRKTRISEIVTRASSPEWRRGHLTFHTRGDDETQRRSDLPVLVPSSKNPHDPLYGVRFDSEGRIYIPRWLEVHSIEEGADIFGPVQKGRNYSKNPPKTKQLQRLSCDYIPTGVDVALRRTETIRDKYRLENPQQNTPLEDNKEARQLIKGLEVVARIRRQTMNLSAMSEQDLLEFAQQIAEYLTEYGMDNPRSTDKKRIRDMYLRGMKDKTGRVNPLAVFARTLSIEVNWRKRLENAFPNILTKYTNNAEMLRYERGKTRWALSHSLDRLRTIAGNPQLCDPTISQKGAEERYKMGKDRYQELLSVSQEMLSAVRVRPYLLGAYAAVSQLGTHFLPEATSMRKIQERKIAQGVSSVTDLLREGNFTEARDKLIFIINFLQKILDLHADYHTVKASKKRRKRLDKTNLHSDED